MIVVAQHVTVTWTKASRGAPASLVRNAVPEAFPLPVLPDPPWVLALHSVNADEHRGFETTDSLAVDLQWTRSQPARIRVDERGVHVAVWVPGSPPGRRLSVRPGLNEAVRLRWNRRFAGSSIEWTYQKFVLNLLVSESLPAANAFVATEPALRKDALADLF